MTTGNDIPDTEEIDCLEAINNLYAYLDGELNDAEAVAKFEHHLSHCQTCYSRRELENLMSDRIRDNAQGRAPTSLRNRLKSVLDEL